MKFKVKVDDQEQEITVTRQGQQLQVTISGQTTEVRVFALDGPQLVLEYEDGALQRHLLAAGQFNGDRRQLWVNGSLLHYERVRERGGATPAGDTSLSATIPAIVSEILVKVGDEVKAGDKLILLESMKMILPIQAPYNGRIRQINCTAGQPVQPGLPLLEIA